MLDSSSQNFDVLNSTSTDDSLQALDSSALIPETAYGLETSTPTDTSSSLLPVENLETGIFTVGESGEVTFDYLFDGGNFEGELAVFSLEGMEALELGSSDFIQEAARRALTNSTLGHIVISDPVEGTRFSGQLPYEPDFNVGEYSGSKTFEMNPGERFGLMLVADTWTQEVFDEPGGSTSTRPLFSMTEANPGENNVQFVKLLDIEADDNAFAFEDLLVEGKSDRDYNDLTFQVQGAIGQATLLDDVINPTRDWRASDVGQEILIHVGSSDNGSLKNIGSDLAQVFLEYETYIGSGGDPSLFESSNFLLQVQDGQIVVDAVASDTDDANSLLADLTALGLQQGAVFGAVVSGLLPIEAIDEISTIDNLTFANPAYQPLTNIGSADARQPVSQIDQAINSNVARRDFNVDGNGVTVGVISDSYNALGGATNDVQSGDLPGINNPNQFETAVDILKDDDDNNNTDEGRAMAQLIHDVAPGANLAFHTGFNGTANFAQGIIDLADAGANVIVDDLTYHNQPMFQDGIIAQAVDRVVDRGVAYFSSAGNQANNSYENSFVSSGQIIQGFVAHDFDPGPGVDTLQQITIPAETNLAVSLQWDSPFLSASSVSGGATSDLNIYLLDDTGTQVLARSTGNNIGRDAVEVLSFTNDNLFPTQFNLAITNPRGDTPNRLKYILLNTSTINEFATNSSTVFGHHAATGAMAVGSAFYRNPTDLAADSSVGPTTILFDQLGNRLTTPEIRQKPEIVAPHGTNTTFFPALDNNGDGVDDSDIEQDGFPNFFGTSAAAPHAAGVAALMLEVVPGTPPDILYEALKNSAIDMGAPGVDNQSGAGLIQADAAIRELQRLQALPEINLHIPDITVTPSHTDNNADRDFKGHGPRIRIQTQAVEVEQGTALRATGNVIFEETKSDFTTFSSNFLTDISRTVRPGFVIDEILNGGGLDVLETTDVELHTIQEIRQDGNDLVQRYQIQGDTRGSDKPFVSIDFNPVRLQLRSPTGKLIEDTFLLPPMFYAPPKVGVGDSDFKGHGPQINIETELQINENRTTLIPHVAASFKEWENGKEKKDFTTFSGQMNGKGIDISQRHPGFTIENILSDSRDTLGDDLDAFLDVGKHSQQVFSFDSNELVRKYKIEGDSKGRDQPYVTLSFNPVRVKLRRA